MKVFTRILGTWALIVFVSISAAVALDNPVVLRVAAQAPGLTSYGTSTTLAKLLEKYGPPGSKLEIIPRGGSMSNPTTLDQGRCELAFAQVASSIWAWNGMPEIYPTYGKHRNIRFLTPGIFTFSYLTVLARRDYVEKTGLDTLEKMLTADDPPRIIMKPQGSIVVPTMEGIFRSIGNDMEDFRKTGKIFQVPLSQFSDMLRDARADVYIDVVPTNYPSVEEILMTNDLLWIPISERMLKYMEEVMAMPPEVIPEGGFKGVTKDGYISPADGQNIIIHKDVPDDVAYLLAKLICEHRDVLIDENGYLKGWDPAKNLQSVALSMPVHPGAARYYKEQGWMK